MKKIKLLTTLFVSALAMSSLAACTTPSQADIKAVLPAVSEIHKEGLNIESVTFENIPNEIPVGSFDSFDMKLKIVYSDDSIEYYPLLIENFPDSLKLLFNTVGSHTVTISFRGKEVTYTFNVTQGPTYFLVRYFSYDGRIIQREQVVPEVGKVTAAAPSEDKVKRESDPLYHYDFLDWSENLEVGEIINSSHDIYPEYKITQKRYDASKQVVPTVKDTHLRLISVNKSGEYYGQYGAYIYLGRIDRVPLLYSASAEKDVTLTPYEPKLYFEHADESGTATVINEIYNESIIVDTTDFDAKFKDSSKSPKAPVLVNTNFNVPNPDVPILFEGDTSYSELYQNSVYSFVTSHGSSNVTEFSINPAENMLEGNKYYRAAIETSVDVIIYAQFDTNDVVEPGKPKRYQFTNFEYLFAINNSNTYKVTEYTDSSGEFNSTGTKLTYSMSDLDAILKNVVEG